MGTLFALILVEYYFSLKKDIDLYIAAKYETSPSLIN